MPCESCQQGKHVDVGKKKHQRLKSLGAEGWHEPAGKLVPLLMSPPVLEL